MLPSVLTLLGFAASGVAAPDTGAQGVMPFPFGLLDGASDPSTPVPPPPPPPPTAVGGWVYDPFSRHRKRRDEDDEPEPPPIPAEPTPVLREPEPAVDLAALDARISALAEQIERSRRGRKRMRERMAELQRERAIAARMADWRRRIADDEEWFMLS